MHVDERKLHVDGRRKLGLFGLELLQFDDFAGLVAGRSRAPFGHDAIIGHARAEGRACGPGERAARGIRRGVGSHAHRE
jgi:hypothetical protein